MANRRACFSVDVAPVPLPAAAERIGVDVGLTHFATLSDGTAIANPRHARRAEAQLRRAQPRPEDPEPTLASVSGVWVVGRS
jgi:transposase